MQWFKFFFIWNLNQVNRIRRCDDQDELFHFGCTSLVTPLASGKRRDQWLIARQLFVGRDKTFLQNKLRSVVDCVYPHHIFRTNSVNNRQPLNGSNENTKTSSQVDKSLNKLVQSIQFYLCVSSLLAASGTVHTVVGRHVNERTLCEKLCFDTLCLTQRRCVSLCH